MIPYFGTRHVVQGQLRIFYKGLKITTPDTFGTDRLRRLRGTACMDGGSADCVNTIQAAVYKQELKEVSGIATGDTGTALPETECNACQPCSPPPCLTGTLTSATKHPGFPTRGSPLCLKFVGCYVTYAIEQILYAYLNRYITAPDVAGS